jgi:site-specific DNA-methyltransferase (adenine-specific)
MNANDRNVMFSHKNDEYQTPQKLFDLLDAEFHFNVDAAANSENTKCPVFMDNALDAPIWTTTKETFFLNPPYSKIGLFIKKSYEESLKGATVVCLIPVRSDTDYWHTFVMRAEEIRFILHRLKFDLPKELQGEDYKLNSAPFPSCIVVFRNHCGSTKISSYKF